MIDPPASFCCTGAQRKFRLAHTQPLALFIYLLAASLDEERVLLSAVLIVRRYEGAESIEAATPTPFGAIVGVGRSAAIEAQAVIVQLAAGFS